MYFPALFSWFSRIFIAVRTFWGRASFLIRTGFQPLATSTTENIFWKEKVILL